MMNRVIGALFIFLLLAGCGGGPRERPPLEGSGIGGAFALTNQDGALVRDSDFAGKFRLVYFGYASCPDVCPVDLQKLMAGYALLEKQDAALAAKIQPLFITVDPERDTPVALKTFVNAFHPKLIGLTGTPAQIAEAAKRFKIYYQKEPADKNGRYTVNHSRMSMLFGPKGEPLALIPEAGSPEEMVAEIKRWAR